jgi:hypothetical protein
MSRSSEVTLKEAIHELLRVYKLNDKLNEVKLVGAYPKVVGKLIANHTLELRVRHRVLQIRVDSAALKQELMYMRGKLIIRLNKAAGTEVIDDIRLL